MVSNAVNKQITNNEYSSKVLFKLDTFDGPMDLLLELVKEKKTDILTLDIVELTVQYLEFVNGSLKTLPIDDISEYLVIASYLTELKSKMIISELTNQEIDVESELEIDRLRHQLFLYKQYKDVVNEFRTYQHQRMQYIAKPCDSLDKYIPDEMPYAELPTKIDIERLADAWRRVLLDKENNKIDKVFKISVNNIDVDVIEKELIEFFSKNTIEKLNFNEFVKFFNNKISNLEYICAIFFALLSLSKNGLIKLNQKNDSDHIFISKNNENMIDHVHEEVLLAVDQQKKMAHIFEQELMQNKMLTRQDIKENQIQIKNLTTPLTDNEEILDEINNIINSEIDGYEDDTDDDNDDVFDE